MPTNIINLTNFITNTITNIILETNKITNTNFITETNSIINIPTSNWDKASVIATIIIPIILTIWGIVSEKRKDKRQQQHLALEKSQELEKQKQLSDLAQLKDFIDTQLIPYSQQFSESYRDEFFQRIHHLEKLYKVWQELLQLSQNKSYAEAVQEEFQKASEELKEYHHLLSHHHHSTWIPFCTQDLDELYKKITTYKEIN